QAARLLGRPAAPGVSRTGRDSLRPRRRAVFSEEPAANRMSFDPEAVRKFEHAGWEQAAAQYDATFARATAPFVEALLDTAGIAAGMTVLDVCCGTGVVTAAAARHGARAVGVDFSPAMLNQARQAYPALQFDKGD